MGIIEMTIIADCFPSSKRTPGSISPPPPMPVDWLFERMLRSSSESGNQSGVERNIIGQYQSFQRSTT